MPKIEDANVELMDDKQELMAEEKHELAVDNPQTDSHLSAFSGEVTSRDVSIPKIKLFHPPVLRSRRRYRSHGRRALSGHGGR